MPLRELPTDDCSNPNGNFLLQSLLALPISCSAKAIWVQMSGLLLSNASSNGGGYESPYTLKKIADYWFALSVNRLVFHTSAHQPLETKPGNTMVGTHINRNITWAEQARPFVTSIFRVSYMLSAR